MQKSYLLLFIILLFITLSGIFFLRRNFVDTDLDLSKITGKYNPTEYTTEQLQNLLKNKSDKYVVIDVRTKQEYDKGHIPGSAHADYHDFMALVKVAGSKLPITYDAFSSMRGPYAAYLLYQKGYSNVGILYGGLTAWAEDIEKVESSDGNVGSVFMHPKNIFPDREKNDYPSDQGEIVFTIEARKFYYTPNKLEVKHGQKVILNLISKDVIHGFALPEYAIEEELLPNESKQVSFIAERKGNFSFITNVISGRDYASMVGNIIVK